MATSARYMAPSHSDDADLEEKYWKSMDLTPPIYAADVANTIIDPEVRISPKICCLFENLAYFTFTALKFS